MGQDSSALDLGGGEAAPPELATAALIAHPRFPEAVRACAGSMIELHSRSRFLGWFLSDRVLAVLAHAAISLDADARDDDPESGLTPGRFKAFCSRTGMCGEGRATAILAFMRLTGHLAAETHPADRRSTRLRPSDKLLETMRSRLGAEFASVALVCPDVGPLAQRLGCADFERGLAAEFLNRFTIGSRLIDRAPDLRLFLERDVGALILFALMLGADASDTLPPAQPVPLSIAALARRFHVSRTHVLRLVRDAEAAGLLSRVGEKGEQVAFSPKLQQALQQLFAYIFQFSALCALNAEARSRG